MANLLWLQGQCCSGNTMSLLGAEEPNILDLLTEYGVNLVWHPSLSLEMGDALRDIMNRFIHGEDTLDVLVIEGAVTTGPDGTGAYNMFCGRPFKDWVWSLADVGRGPGRFLAAGVYDEPDSRFPGRPEERHTWLKAGFYDGERLRPFDHRKVVEHIAHSWFDGYEGGRHPWEGVTRPHYTGGDGRAAFDPGDKYS